MRRSPLADERIAHETAAPEPRKSARALRLHAAVRWVKNRYFTVDDRTLGLLRIALGLLLFADLAKRAAGLSVWYTDDGLLPRALAEMHAPDSWSFFWLLGSKSQVIAGFVICAVCYAALTIGFLTPLAAALSLACACSLQHRIELLAMGADAVIVLTLWWTLLLPIGRRFSLDARSRKRRPLGNGKTVSVAVFALKLQLSAIYLFNALHKSGATWAEGSAAHYSLWLDRVATPFAVWLRDVLPAYGSPILTSGIRWTEALIPILVLSPVFVRWAERAALVAIFGLHFGIALCMNVGLFSPSMVVLSLVLVSSEDWNTLVRRFPPLAARLVRGRRPAGGLADGDGAPVTRVARGLVRVRESVLIVLVWLMITQLLADNAAAARLVHFRPPPAQAWLVGQARLGQRWGMFSPDVGTGEMTLVVDALNEAGERIDPYNLAAGAHLADPRSREIPAAIGYDMYWHSYTRLVPDRPDFTRR